MPEDWTLAQWADDIRRLCETLGIERPIVMGSSFGGIVAQAYATRHPDHPAKLILHCTTPKFSLPRIAAKFEQLGGARAADLARALWRDPGDPALLGPYSEVCMPLYNTQRRDPGLTKDWGIAHAGGVDAFLFVRRRGPPLRLRAAAPPRRLSDSGDGRRGGPICPITDSEDIVAALPSGLARFRRFANCGHGIGWDDPEGFVAAIRDFVLA